MYMRTIEIMVGAFMLAGILALAFLAVAVSGVNLGTAPDTYTLHARFTDVSGLPGRAKVSLAGVTVGRVSGVRVDVEYAEAVVTMEIEKRYRFSTDTGAKILTEGILGGRYVALVPGADEEYLVEGDTIEDTQGAMIFEDLVGDVITSIGGD